MVEVDIILEILGVHPRALKSKNRIAKIVEARKIVSYILLEKKYDKNIIAVYSGYNARQSIKSAVDSLLEEMSINNKLKEKVITIHNKVKEIAC